MRYLDDDEGLAVYFAKYDFRAARAITHAAAYRSLIGDVHGLTGKGFGSMHDV